MTGLDLKFSKIRWRLRRHARESGHPEAFNFPGFRDELATASSPGMTITPSELQDTTLVNRDEVHRRPQVKE
jgi:hypothetical protein